MEPDVVAGSRHACPFCPYSPPRDIDADFQSYDLAHHVEVTHQEADAGPSPFQVRPSETPSLHAEYHGGGSRGDGTQRRSDIPASSRLSSGGTKPDTGAEYVECPRDCGETVPRQMIDQHIALHQAEDIALDELEAQYQLERVNTDGEMVPDEGAIAKAIEEAYQKPTSRTRGFINELLSMSPTWGTKSADGKTGQRLGRRELGPHAYEEKMPVWLFKQLKEGPPVSLVNQIGPDGKLQRIERVANETAGLIPALAKFCRQDKSVSKAWLCSPGVKHIFKMRREGGFCGYRNIQMQVSWMQHHGHPGWQHFGSTTPNILDLQVFIEEAWKNGFNSSGKVETGGIIGTRKYIGTPEAQALFQFLNIPCRANQFTKNKAAGGVPVYSKLLEFVCDYFSEGVSDLSEKVYLTDRPPIYFQHPGHSLTIVGIEAHKNGSINLLVFDPMFATVPAMLNYLGSGLHSTHLTKVLKAFRRGEDYLKKYKSFEVLRLELPAQLESALHETPS